MRIIIIFFLSLPFFNCHSKKSREQKFSDSIKSVDGYDTIKFNHKLELDTFGYGWMFENRSILDTLKLQKAVVISKSDTFLSLPKYARLWSQPIPSQIVAHNDTILVSGVVYKILSSNGGKGYPTLITELIYNAKK